MINASNSPENKNRHTPAERARNYKLANEGNIYAQFALAFAYFTGSYGKRDPVESMRWCSATLQKGLPLKKFLYGMYHFTGFDVPKDYAIAFRWWLEAANDGDHNHNAQIHTAWTYTQGVGISNDSRKAFAWWLKATEQRESSAQYTLARHYQDGDVGSMSKIKIQRLRLLIFAVAISVSLPLAGCGLSSTLPTDSALKVTLNTHRQAFTQLITMANQDQHVLDIMPNYFSTDVTVPDSQKDLIFPKARWMQYLRLFNEVGCQGIIRRKPLGAIFFYITNNGSVISSVSKGLVYSPVKLSLIVQSLDGDALWDNAQKTGKMTEAYVDLGDGWYIFKNAY